MCIQQAKKPPELPAVDLSPYEKKPKTSVIPGLEDCGEVVVADPRYYCGFADLPG